MPIFILLLLLPQITMAKTKVDVSQFENRTAPSPCNAVEPWKKGIDEAFQAQLVQGLDKAGGFQIVESEIRHGEDRAKLFDSGVSTVRTKTTFKASQYSVVGRLKKFDLCDRSAHVEFDIVVIENASGKVWRSFVSEGKAKSSGNEGDFKGASFNTGLFKDSALGRATSSAIGQAVSEMKRAFPDREVASQDLRVRTFRRSRSR